MNYEDIFDKLMYFKPFINKTIVLSHLKIMGKYPDFNSVYSKNRQDDENLDPVKNVCMTLVLGLQTGAISLVDLDELLFLLIEDKLFTSFLFNLEDSNQISKSEASIQSTLNEWGVPKEKNILKGLSQKETFEKFVIAGHRTNQCDSIRLLLLDKNLITLKEKNKEPELAVYATLIEIDFRRNLLHVRLKDVDKIESSQIGVRTLEGRIERTLKFLDSLQPFFSYKRLSNFRASLFRLEEHLLQPKREAAHKELTKFQQHIDNFSSLIDSNFPTNHENGVTTQTYVSNTVLAIISSSLDLSQIGDVVGIKFRNQRDESTTSFAEVAISDKGFKCISTDKLYWSNLATLLEQRKIEFLKIGTLVPSGFVDVNLEFRIETANIKLNQSSKGTPSEGDKRPTDEKYSDFVDYLLPFIR
ncbi:hypothetical protein NYE25_06540 [Paenibacillus sp. FSL E2-8871]|uniref:hypothetical protein n=1 Tax=Paenibacillus sp. FSL E2-8871 TaxID=2975326 RepID=UPI0030F61C7C